MDCGCCMGTCNVCDDRLHTMSMQLAAPRSQQPQAVQPNQPQAALLFKAPAPPPPPPARAVGDAITLPNGATAWFDSAGQLINRDGEMIDTQNRTTRVRGKPGRGYTEKRRLLEARAACQRAAAAAASAEWHMRREAALAATHAATAAAAAAMVPPPVAKHSATGDFPITITAKLSATGDFPPASPHAGAVVAKVPTKGPPPGVRL